MDERWEKGGRVRFGWPFAQILCGRRFSDWLRGRWWCWVYPKEGGSDNKRFYLKRSAQRWADESYPFTEDCAQ